MAWTVADAIRQAREVIQDTEGDRHTDEKLVGYLNQAMSQAKRLRPDLFLPGLATTPTPFYTVADITSPTPPVFPFDDTYYTAVVEYISGFTALGDDEFAQDNRAGALLNRFELSLTGGN